MHRPNGRHSVCSRIVGYCPGSGAGCCSFDIPDVEYSHYEDRCTFDYILQKHKLDDSALYRIAAFVRGADTDDHIVAPEAAGLWAISAGLAFNISTDQQLLAQELLIYNALYSWAKHLQSVKQTQSPTERLLRRILHTYQAAPGKRKTPDWGQLALFVAKAGAFAFGSGLAIVPFLYWGVVKEYGWLNEQQFLDAVAVAMITPGPVVITVAFIGYLVAGFPGACVAGIATFLPCYLFTILPAPYIKRWGKHPGVKTFVDGVIIAAIGAIAGAVVVLARRRLIDIPYLLIALITVGLLYQFKKTPELAVIGGAAVAGLLLRSIS
ncbi:chromate efflux transporter [Spirosoma sp.]|uniref:chromate efflux transporter n=1 Tax=Spirosoma sp. TaxID=1899569 RepID=UPI003436482A